jgi:hypothetical protein
MPGIVRGEQDYSAEVMQFKCTKVLHRNGMTLFEVGGLVVCAGC